MEESKNHSPEAELDDDSTRFSKSIQELKDLCSQLHYAADYCQATFVNAQHPQKKTVVENTKEYLCRAVVTVVDHLGSASANIDCQLSKDNNVSETELRINGLKQRLLTCQQYSHKLALTKVRWKPNAPRYNLRYIFPPMPDRRRSKEVLRICGTPIAAKTTNSKHEFETEEEVPLFLYTSNQKPSLTKNSITETDCPISPSVLPVRDGLSLLPKAPNPSFHFEGTRKIKRNTLNWKSVQNNDFMSLIRKTKRAV